MENKTPKDWQVVKLGDVVEHVKDKVLNRSEWTFDRYIGGEHFDEGEIRITKSAPIEGNEEVIGSAFHMRFKPGQVLYVTRNPRLRKGGMVDFEGVCSNVTFTLQANEKKLSQKLLPFIIQTETFTKHACNSAHGSTNPFLNWKDIASYDLLLPPMSEQKKIAEVLWAIEETIKGSENYLKFNQKMMSKLMIDLFTKGINSKKLKLIHLGEECKKIQYGYTASADTSQVGPKFLRITDISSGKVNWDKVPYCKCSDKDIEDNLLKKGDIVFARTGASTGASYLFDDSIKAVFASYLIRMQLTDNLLPKFVAYYFKSKLYWDQVASNIAGSAQGGINSKVLSSLMIPFPSKEEQNQIIKILDKTDIQINSIKNNLNSLKALRQKLMNELLLGKLRLE